jgi:hypothetical protein
MLRNTNPADYTLSRFLVGNKSWTADVFCCGQESVQAEKVQLLSIQNPKHK